MERYRILVTGGAGFIGSHLVRKLCELGHQVTVYDSLLPQVHGSTSQVMLPQCAHLVQADIRDYETLAASVADADVIYHLASLTGVGQSMYEIRNYVDVNETGTAVLLQRIVDRPHTIKRLVLASSRAVYGEGKYWCPRCQQGIYPQGRDAEQLAHGIWDPLCPNCGDHLSMVPVDETSIPQPGSIYAVNKLAQEGLFQTVGRAYNIPTVILRFFNVYGVGQSLSNPYTGVLSVFASIIAADGTIEVYEDGKESRDFVNVRDVVRACILSLNPSTPSGIYNIGSGTAISIGEVAKQIIQAMEVEMEPVITGKYRVGDIRHCVADIEKARRFLRYKPTVTFEQGIHEFIAWAREHLDQGGQQLYHKAKTELESRGLYR